MKGGKRSSCVGQSAVLLELKQAGLPENTILLVATKGLCENPVQLFSSKIESEFNNPYAFISGPNFAREVAEDKSHCYMLPT